MAVTIKNLATVELSTTTQTIYTSPTNTRTRITHCNIVNYSAGAVTWTAWRVPAGGSPAAGNKITNLKSVAINASDQAPEVTGQVLDAGDSIRMEASGNSALVVTMSGQQVA